MKKGDWVTIQYEGRELDAWIALASENGRSLIIHFDAVLGGYVGMMPLSYMDEIKEYVDLINNRVVKLVPKQS